MFKRKNKNRRVDWSQKKYGNPLFKQPASSRKTNRSYLDNWQLKLFTISLIAIIYGIFWLFFLSPVFKINSVEIIGNERIAREEFETKFWQEASNKRWWVIPELNLLAFDSAKLERQFKNDYVLESLTVKKKPFHRILIELKEKSYGLIWNEGGAFYWINPDGTVIIQATGPGNSTTEKLPLIVNEGEWVVKNNRVENQAQKIDFIVKLYDKLRSSQLKLTPEKFVINTSDNPSVRVISPQMPVIIFNQKDDLDKQLDRLISLIKGMIKSDLNKKTRIDLRFGEKIFFE